MLSSPTALHAESSLEPGYIQADLWNITVGTTLKTTLEDRGRIANPSWSVISFWSVIREYSSDYRIQTFVTFNGSFEDITGDVTGRLADVIHTSHPELSSGIVGNTLSRQSNDSCRSFHFTCISHAFYMHFTCILHAFHMHAWS